MMGRTALLLSVLASAGAILATPAVGAAQCRLCAAPVTSRDQAADQAPISLDVETRLDFDRLILLGEGEGTATLLPNGTRSVSGVISDMTGRAMVGSGVVRGEAGRLVRVELPSRIDLYSLSGGRISIENVTSDLSPAPRLDASGSLNFRFGGRLHVSGDADGDYRGDVPITVEYL